MDGPGGQEEALGAELGVAPRLVRDERSQHSVLFHHARSTRCVCVGVCVCVCVRACECVCVSGPRAGREQALGAGLGAAPRPASAPGRLGSAEPHCRKKSEQTKMQH